jgi:hypothetical protein
LVIAIDSMDEQSHWLGIVKLSGKLLSVMLCCHIGGLAVAESKEFGLREKISSTEDSVQDTALLYGWYHL